MPRARKTHIFIKLPSRLGASVSAARRAPTSCARPRGWTLAAAAAVLRGERTNRKSAPRREGVAAEPPAGGTQCPPLLSDQRRPREEKRGLRPLRGPQPAAPARTPGCAGSGGITTSPLQAPLPRPWAGRGHSLCFVELGRLEESFLVCARKQVRRIFAPRRERHVAEEVAPVEL